MPRPVLSVTLLGTLSAVTGVHLWAQWMEQDRVADGTQWLLMPLLAGALWLDSRPDRPRLARLTLVALLFSWLGDALPRFFSGDAEFLVMVGCFLLAQVTYIVAFRPYADRSVFHVGRVALAPYVVAVALLVALCADGAGSLLVPVLVYGACLGVMAVLATGVNPMVWAGGAVFLVSDGLIALGAFSEIEIAHDGFWIMLTYVVAQVLIVLGVEERDPAEVS
ncbi:lysoplasmalogenase [Nocardioides jensenii]|uniref:lysoplasmalogenase n=1 Tax=Nocardioides jensenii TaxID=1843 RepID=UPI000A62F19A|nr:lysoplasmalogenase [Nocardioides jensenii]